MIERYHSMGMKVILWATPFFEKESQNYKVAEKNRYLIMDAKGDAPYVTEWWNGQAALVDLSNPMAYEWFLGLLRNLARQYGIDGYKLDAGDGEFLAKPFTSFGQISSSKYTDLYASIGRFFDINELRVSWMVQELGLVQRLRDKDPSWSRVDGLNSLIPHGLAEGLIGYQYFCPDIIGGGLDSGFYGPDAKGIDAELFVRWAEASALMPMMQYSYAPWRMDEKSVSICRKYSKLHEDLGNYIYSLALKTSRDGTPIIRPLFFRNPEDEMTYEISTQFMLGDRFLAAPVLKKGASSRDIYLPQGTWVDFWSGKIYAGSQTLKDYPAPLEVLPMFICLEP
jgi:alpha-glucosidase (family GH31 glycosyl hydrolase)